MSTRFWKITTNDNPFRYRAERDGFVIEAEDPKKFTVKAPDGSVICDDLGTSLEAHRLGDAAHRRANP